MSIIQSIRDRAAVLVFAIIAISLIGFLVQDAFIGRSRGLFSSHGSSVGSVNGKDIDINDFSQRLKLAEDGYQQRGLNMNDDMRQRLQEQIWSGYVEQELIQSEVEKLGLAFTPKELGTLLFSEDAPQEFKQQFTDPKTGIYNIDAARDAFRSLQRSKNSDQLKAVNDQLLQPIVLNELRAKYISLFTGGAYVPKWVAERITEDNSAIASINYVATSYSTISDSVAAVKVTDADINAYVQKHKDEFKQDKARNVSYVVFDAAPSALDSGKVYQQLANLKPEFAEAIDAKAFLAKNGSTLEFLDAYMQKGKLQMAAKDSIISLPVGKVYGPYLDGGSYVLARKIDVKQIPDSVHCRHILIGTVDPNTGQATHDDSTAQRRADSIARAVQSGADFKVLAARFSDDEGSKLKGGEYDFASTQTNLAREFADFIFNNKTGDKKVVKTQFGYHYIEILGQKNFDEGVKVAYMAKQITTSKETDDSVSAAATAFAASSRDLKSFDDNIVKNRTYNKRLADDVHENDFSISSLGSSRSLVRWIFENKVGTVSEPFNVADKYVVVAITRAKEEGTQSAADARNIVEPILRNQKKAAEIIKKMGTPTSLDALASANQNHVLTADSLNFATPFIPQLGNEPKVIGAAFDKNYEGKIAPPIAGNAGVFYIQSKLTGTRPVADGGADVQRRNLQMQMKQMANYSATQALHLAAKIEDNRREAGY